MLWKLSLKCHFKKEKKRVKPKREMLQKPLRPSSARTYKRAWIVNPLTLPARAPRYPKSSPPAIPIHASELKDGLDARSLLLGKLQEKISKDKATNISFSVACDEALAFVDASTTALAPLDSVHAASTSMLLLELAGHLDKIGLGATLRTLVGRIFPFLFVDWKTAEDESQLRVKLSNSMTHVEVLHENIAALSVAHACASKYRNSIVHRTDVFSRVVTSQTTSLKRTIFKLWRNGVSLRKRNEEQWISLSTLQRNRSVMHIRLMQLALYTSRAKEHGGTILSTSVAEKLSKRVKELTDRCEAREAQGLKYQGAKDRLSQKCEKLDVMLHSERNAAVKVSSVSKAFERESIILHAANREALDLLDTVTGQLFICSRKTLLDVVERDRGGVELVEDSAISTLPESRKTSQLHIGVASELGATSFSIRISHVPHLLLWMINEALLDITVFASSLKKQVVVPEEFNQVMSLAPVAISQFAAHLFDGRVYQLLLWRILAAVHGKEGKSLDCSAMLKYFENDCDRCAGVLSMTRFLGMDEGFQVEQLARTDDNLSHLYYSGVLMERYVRTCRPTLSGNDVAVPCTLQVLKERVDSMKHWDHLLRCVRSYCAATRVGAISDPFRCVVQETTLAEVDKLISAACKELRLVTVKCVSEPLQWTIGEFRSILSCHRSAFNQIASYYAACSTVDEAEPLIDVNAWARVVQDGRWAKTVTKPDQFVKNFCESLQQLSSTLKFHSSLLCVAITKVFLLKMPALHWKSVEASVDAFKTFIEDAVQSLQKSLIGPLSLVANSAPVQDVLNKFREPLKKLFAEFSNNTLRILRVGDFCQLVTRDLKLMDAVEAQQLFHSCRFANVVGVTVGAIGMDYSVFCVALVALSRKHDGNPLLSNSAVLLSFIVQSLFPMYQFKLKLKW